MIVTVAFECHRDSDTSKKKAVYFRQFMGHRLIIAMADAHIGYKLVHTRKNQCNKNRKLLSKLLMLLNLYALRALGNNNARGYATCRTYAACVLPSHKSSFKIIPKMTIDNS
jgi:hypothetical protein